MATDKERLTVYLPPDLCRRAKATAALEGMSLSAYLEILIRSDLQVRETPGYVSVENGQVVARR